MIDIHSEHMLTISQASQTLPGRPHVSTIWRWVNRGCRGVRLETVLIGGTRYTSREALQRMVDATTAVAAGEPTPSRTPRQRQADIDRAERELADADI